MLLDFTDVLRPGLLLTRMGMDIQLPPELYRRHFECILPEPKASEEEVHNWLKQWFEKAGLDMRNTKAEASLKNLAWSGESLRSADHGYGYRYRAFLNNGFTHTHAAGISLDINAALWRSKVCCTSDMRKQTANYLGYSSTNPRENQEPLPESKIPVEPYEGRKAWVEPMTTMTNKIRGLIGTNFLKIWLVDQFVNPLFLQNFALSKFCFFHINEKQCPNRYEKIGAFPPSTVLSSCSIGVAKV